MPILARNKNRDGSDITATPKALLPADKARFCGEALAMVIATSVAVARDAAELVDPDQPDAMAIAIHRLLTDEALRERRIALGRAQAGRFSWSRCAAEHVALFEQVAKRGDAPAASATIHP